jgi:hypothetical protein
MAEPFTLLRSQGGDRLQGAAGDWLLQYAPGDYGIAVNERFARLYRPSAEAGSAEPGSAAASGVAAP